MSNIKGRGAEPFLLSIFSRNNELKYELIQTGHDPLLPGYGKMDNDGLGKQNVWKRNMGEKRL